MLENLADGTWSNGVSASEDAGQAAAVGMSSRLYSDLLVTLFEDGLLVAESDELIRQLQTYEREKETAFRNRIVIWFSVSTVYSHVSVTYRGRRRIDELRAQLRHDRVLERFGILIDGRYIVSDLIHFLERAGGEAVSLLFADVDDFKQFNSQYGYKAGDEVLRNVFRITRRIVGNHGEVYRRGGEEIIAILPYVDLKRATEIGERILEDVRSSAVQYENDELHATLSMGLAASPPHDPDGPGLETHAENALKQAKNSGKNCLIVG